MLRASVGRCIGRFCCHRLNCSRQRALCNHNSTTTSSGATPLHETWCSWLNRLMKRKPTKKSLVCPAKSCLTSMKQESTMASSAVNAPHGNPKSTVSYMESRPTAVNTSLDRDGEEATHMIDEPVVPPAPRHALRHGESGGFFFPSPRSVLERRSSSGSFF